MNMQVLQSLLLGWIDQICRFLIFVKNISNPFLEMNCIPSLLQSNILEKVAAGQVFFQEQNMVIFLSKHISNNFLDKSIT